MARRRDGAIVPRGGPGGVVLVGDFDVGDIHVNLLLLQPALHLRPHHCVVGERLSVEVIEPRLR